MAKDDGGERNTRMIIVEKHQNDETPG